jgi:hypothetical protein
MTDQEIIRQLSAQISNLTTTVAILQERLDWIVRFFWILTTATIGTFVTNIWQLIYFKRKKQ